VRENLFVVRQKQRFRFFIPLVDLFHKLKEVFFIRFESFHWRGRGFPGPAGMLGEPGAGQRPANGYSTGLSDDAGDVTEGEGGRVDAARGDDPEERVVGREVEVGIPVSEDDG
jgi:hypothetical protein